MPSPRTAYALVAAGFLLAATLVVYADDNPMKGLVSAVCGLIPALLANAHRGDD